jgi:hypothetical protein
MIVWEVRHNEPDVDLTRRVAFEVSNHSVATVNVRGQVSPVSEGVTHLVIGAAGKRIRVPVEVREIREPNPVSFANDVLPILTKAGCNSGSCHGKAEGQNGFKLSVFGFDPLSDHEALVKEGRGRRVSAFAPEQSLLLQKATGQTPHGGGRLVDPGSPGYRRMLRWIREGTRFNVGNGGAVTGITVFPAELSLAPVGRQQLRIVATDSAGHTRDVTAESQFESNAPAMASVDETGLVRAGETPGEAAILVRYMNQVALCQIRMPRPGVTIERPPENNFIDALVWDKLQQVGIEPSPDCDDATFLRRVYLDVIGTLPTAREAVQFLDSERVDKRSRLIDELLERREYSSYWTLLWSDLLRVDANALGAESSVAMTRWLNQQFANNRPYDEMVRDILTASGSTQIVGPSGLYLTLDSPDALAGALSQLFLGVRIECAQCHHHPFERWSQQDYTGFAGFFTGIKRKTLPNGSAAIVAEEGSDLKHPRTGERVPAAGLGTEAAVLDSQTTIDRRQVLADWMTSDENPYLARALANRLWAHYFGRGLVDPVDDLRDTNPATNEPLLEALADHLRNVNYDIKAFTRTLLNSRAYQLSAETRATNIEDDQNFSHAAYRPLPAEVLLDAICQVTDIPEKFNGWPAGARAIEVWDNRMPSYFFRVFGRPGRTSVCECERGDAPTISQALHLMNSTEISDKIGHRHGRARRLAASEQSPPEVVETLFLTTLSRRPSEQERELMLQVFEQDGIDRQAAVEDVMWTLINTKEFLFTH